MRQVCRCPPREEPPNPALPPSPQPPAPESTLTGEVVPIPDGFNSFPESDGTGGESGPDDIDEDEDDEDDDSDFQEDPEEPFGDELGEQWTHYCGFLACHFFACYRSVHTKFEWVWFTVRRLSYYHTDGPDEIHWILVQDVCPLTGASP